MNIKLMPLKTFQLLIKPFNGKQIMGKNINDIYIIQYEYEKIRRILSPKDIITEVNGYKIKVNYAMGGIANQIVKKEFEPLSTKVFLEECSKRKGDLIDVGANVGYYTLLGAKYLKDENEDYLVHAFEAEAKNYIMLCDNVNLNHFTNIKMQPGAVSDKVGIATLYISEKESGEHNIVGSHELHEQYYDSYEINTVTLDSIWNEDFSKIHPVRGIKIDVEGAEVKVLKGALNLIRKYHPFILIECWQTGLINAGSDLEEFLGILNSFNYKIKGIDEFRNELIEATPELILHYFTEHKFSINLVCS